MSNKDDKTQSESRPEVSPKRIEKRSLSTAQHTDILGIGNDSKQSGGVRLKTASISTAQHTDVLASGNDSKQKNGGNQSSGGSDNVSSSQSEAKGSGEKS